MQYLDPPTAWGTAMTAVVVVAAPLAASVLVLCAQPTDGTGPEDHPNGSSAGESAPAAFQKRSARISTRRPTLVSVNVCRANVLHAGLLGKISLRGTPRPTWRSLLSLETQKQIRGSDFHLSGKSDLRRLSLSATMAILGCRRLATHLTSRGRQYLTPIGSMQSERALQPDRHVRPQRVE